MANSLFAFKRLQGGSDDSYLDYHPATSLVKGDMAFGIYNGRFYAYYLNEDVDAVENSPNVILPDSNDASVKCWVLVSEYKTYVSQD